MDLDAKYALITRNTQEVLGEDIMKNVLKERDLRLYWGSAPTGRVHCGYWVPMTKIADFLKADVEVKILLADIHAFLDNMKAPWELVQYRVKYYAFVIRAMLKAIDVPLDKLTFVTGSEYQYSREYTQDIFRLAALVTEHDARKAGAEVVKQVESPTLSSLMYPGMQALDEEHLGVDVQFGGVDQRKIFVLAQEYLPRLGYKKRAHVMNPMVPGLAGGKMSASLGADNKIDILDDEKVVRKKISKAFCEPGKIEDNGLLSFVKFVVFPIGELKGQASFEIARPEQYGGALRYESYEQCEQDYREENLSPQDLKIGVADYINKLLSPIRKEFSESAEFQEIEKLAYPPPEVVKKEKKQKKKAPRPPHVVRAEEGAKEGATEGSTLEDGVEKINIAQ